MEKLSNEQKIAVLAEVPGVIRSLSAERDFYKSKLATIKDRIRVEKLASAMIEKGLKTGSISQVADDLEKEAKAGRDLAVVEEAVDMIGPDMGKVAHVNDEVRTGGSTDFERFLLS